MTGWLQTHDGLVALLQVAVWLLCLGLAAPSLLRWGKEQPRWFLALLPTLGLASAAISLWWIPSLARFEPLGHSASYFDCYTGNADPSGAVGWEAYVTYPLLRWWHWLLGAVFGGETPRVPLLFEALARGAGVVFVGAAGAVLGRRPSVGAVAAVLLMVHSVHAFWGGTVFNVAIPLAFALLCLWLALLAWRTGQTRLLLAAAASGSLVVAGRVEWGLLAPALLALLLGLDRTWGRADGVKRPGFWIGPIVLALVYGITLFGGGGALTEQGGYHGVRGYLVTLSHQVWILDVFEPLHRSWALLGAAAGALAWWRRGDVGWTGPLGLLLFAVISWCGLATFNDVAYRHALLPGLALVFGLALLAPTLRGRGAGAGAALLLLAASVAGSLMDLSTAADRYYTSPEAFFEQHPGFEGSEIPSAELEASGCYLITDDERLWQMGVAGSHFNLMDPGEATKRWRHHDGCIRWLYDIGHFRQDSLVVRVRGRKLMRWFDWEPVGWTRFEGGLVAPVYAMTSPPWGVADDDPVPPTDILMPWEAEE